MNWRNVQVFGVKELRPKRLYFVLIALVLGAVVWALFTPSGSDGSVMQTPTTMAVQDLPEQEGVQETIVDMEETREELVESVDYTQYGGECAVDIKHADDDVVDVNDYLDDFQNEYNTLQEEYSSKIEDLEDEYVVRLERLRKDIDSANDDLSEAQQKLDNLVNSCSLS